MKEIGPEDHAAGRDLLLRLGVEEEVLTAAEEANPDFNWITLVWALDRVFLAWGGTAAQAAFLRDPRPEVGYRVAAQVMVEPGGLDKVCEAARVYAGSGPLS